MKEQKNGYFDWRAHINYQTVIYSLKFSKEIANPHNIFPCCLLWDFVEFFSPSILNTHYVRYLSEFFFFLVEGERVHVRGGGRGRGRGR